MPSGGGLADVASGATAIGRYFTVVSAVPSAVFASYVLLLINSGAWSGDVALADAIGALTFRDAALLGVATLLLALAVHPLQFAIVQLFEGYWGTSRLAVGLALLLTMRHRRRFSTLAAAADESGYRVQDLPGPTDKIIDVRRRILLREAERLHASYPHQISEIMPTRLGNVLKHYERLVGGSYDLDATAVTPRIAMVAQAREVEYVENQRTQLELAVRTSFLALLATLVTLAFMWRHGAWMFLALAPYLVGYLAYKGAVVVAQEYGIAVAVLIDINRFGLYERLRLPMPDDIEDERDSNARLMQVFRLDNLEVERRREVPLDYSHPKTGDGSAQGPLAGAPVAATAGDKPSAPSSAESGAGTKSGG